MYIIPKVAPKTICKPSAKLSSRSTSKSSKSSKSNVDDHRRLIVNQRERERTSTMNQAFENLKALLNILNGNQESSKVKTLEMTNHYINFLYYMATDDYFFERYRHNPIQIAFKIYMIENQFH